ncbi:hypothetical protein pdam_00023502 [Pocillopora damicornis]|uniref:Uncharacterized protein n=1 Tax=Pocillopora damicornis TaxID=46731 RepID=A0A3M6U640_POCDA|nr:hypothetical protein pdam_00023502 [Pocillopora damicornis]
MRNTLNTDGTRMLSRMEWLSMLQFLGFFSRLSAKRNALHNFEFTSRGLRMWKAFKIGAGKLIAWNNIIFCLQEATCLSEDKLFFVSISLDPKRKSRLQKEVQMETTTEVNSLRMGWALQKPKGSQTRFSDKVRGYLQKKFDISQKTGRKEDPA